MNKKSFVPKEGHIIVYSTIEYQKVREVDAKKRTLAIDFVLNMKRLDPNIRTNFTKENLDKGGITIGEKAVEKICIPDLYINNRAEEEWKSLKTSKVLSTKEIKQVEQEKHHKIHQHENHNENHNFMATIELKYEIKATVYCNFNYYKYPLDEQTCYVEFGSSSFDAIFNLYDRTENSHITSNYDDDALNLKMNIAFFDHGNPRNGNSTIGI